MSNECCKEFTGWVKSFTKTERALTVVEALLLVALIALLTLLILHLIACSKPDHWDDDLQATTKITTEEDREAQIVNLQTESGQLNIYNTSEPANESTDKPDVKCSWTPSDKTTAVKHYYEDESTEASKSYKVNKTTHISMETSAVDKSIASGITQVDQNTHISMQISSIDTETIQVADSNLSVTTTPFVDFEELIRDELSDGEEAEDVYERHVVALVKLKPPNDIIFGCILTIVSEYWTLTAASCIEAIEETDSLDSFVIMEHYGTDNKGPLRAVDDVQIHPLYEGKNKTYDLAALKSASSLTRGGRAPVELATFLDFALLPLAERFIVLGYGAFRSIESGVRARRLRRAHVFKLPVRQCAGGAGADGALRHLSGGRAAPRGACGAPALCAGVLHSRGLPCNYCAGTPLLVRSEPGAALLGVMAEGSQCGAACEPALYVNLADVDVADWVDATLRTDVIH